MNVWIAGEWDIGGPTHIIGVAATREIGRAMCEYADSRWSPPTRPLVWVKGPSDSEPGDEMVTADSFSGYYYVKQFEVKS